VAEVAAQLSDDARLQAMLDVELALAEAEATTDVIPPSAVAAIRAAARVEGLDRAALAVGAARAGNLALPLIQQLTERVARIDPEAARFVHWGATSQDIVDTGLVLQVRGAVGPIVAWLGRGIDAAAVQARRHGGTVMPGRTWLQHATPVTFGLKAAGWVDALSRGRERVERARDAALVLQLGGAAGTLAALGPHGPAVSRELGTRLGLVVPDLPWHTHRDRLADLASALGVTAGTLGKIGADLALLAQSEVAEAREPAERGEGSSSTMPHKRNPVLASVAITAATRAPGLVATMLAAMAQQHERGLGTWQAEWATLPPLLLVTAGAARGIALALEGLVVDPARMRTNLELEHGIPMAEAVVMRLAPALGKREAHAVVAAACRTALAQGRPVLDVLAGTAAVAEVLTRDQIAECLSPDGYLGSAQRFVEAVLARHAARGHA
jgi:3-carboxy-cis,cis-muconate cycloisomerase